jgi:hypothetical protein
VNSGKKFLNPQAPLITEPNCNMKRFRAAKRQREAATRSGNRSGNEKRQKDVRIEEFRIKGLRD